MPATPAWPPESGVRLYVDTLLSHDLLVAIGGQQAHYLTNVMRLKPSDGLTLFDGVTGEWRGDVASVGKRAVEVRIVGHLRPRETVPDLWLAAAPIRRARFDLVAEKACELGIARFTPVMTRRAVVDRVNPGRLRAQMIEAAEQCGRTALPVIDAETKLTEWLQRLSPRTLFFADEGGGQPIVDAIRTNPGPAAFLIGPEGGFDPEERKTILSTRGAVGISLGPRILRAETAAIAAVAIWMGQDQRTT